MEILKRSSFVRILNMVRSALEALEEVILVSSQKTLATRAANCAQRVLWKFETYRPDDFAPQQALTATRARVDNRISVSEARSCAFASHHSAREISDIPSACFAARSAGHAAATAHVAGHAIHSFAIYALKSLEACGGNAIQEWKWQYDHLLELHALE